MYNIRTIFIVLITLTIMLTSCKKDNSILSEVSKTKDVISLFLDLASPELDASIGITNYQMNLGYLRDDGQTQVSLGCVRDKSICNNYQSVTIEDLDFEFIGGGKKYPTDSKFNNFFGRDVNLKFNSNSDNSRNADPEVKMYVPKVLVSDIESRNPILKKGFRIGWNKDTDNKGGVFIIISYKPEQNRKIKKNFPDRTTDYIKVDDTGEYIFSKKDFKKIPKNANIYLTLLRGNYITQEIGEDLVRVYAITNVQGFASLK